MEKEEIELFKKEMLEYAQGLSERISEAIQPLNEISMPIAVVVLQSYAVVMKNDPDFDNTLYDLWKKATSGTILRCDVNNPESVAIFEAIRAGRKTNE